MNRLRSIHFRFTEKTLRPAALLTLTSNRGYLIAYRKAGPERTSALAKDTVMNAQETAPELANEVEAAALPLPTADMDGDALFRLGMMYSSGSGGCPMDRVSAHMIFNLAAMKGSIEARVYRREMSEEMERDEIAEAQRAARRYIDAGVVKLAA
jgi:TPR repeat protein